MTLDYKKPELAQKSLVDQAGVKAELMACDQTFGNVFCWAAVTDARIAVYKESYAVRWGKYYSLPTGPQRGEMLEQLLAEGITRIGGIDERGRQWMEQAFPDRFQFKEKRDSADYIYLRERLASLQGKKLAAKRNHINYFEAHHQWECRPITAENMAEVMAFNEWWCNRNGCPEEASLEREGCAVRRGLRHFEALGYRGLALYADGKICAFTFGEPMGKGGFCVHAEKADAELRGAYPMINREFAKSLPPEIQWMNREDDTGDAGLRRAKLSYVPDILLMKYEAELIK